MKNPKVIFLLFSLVLGLEYIIFGPFSYVRIGDNMDIFIPRLASLWHGFFANGFSFWDARFALGIDRLANDMTYFNAGGLLFGVLPAWIAYGLIILGATWIGGWYTYRLCREHLQLNERASIIAGLLWAYVLITNDVIPYLLGFSVLPAALYYLESLARASRPRYGRAFGLGILFAFFSSVPFTLPFTLIASALWFVVVRRHITRAALAIFVLFAAGAVVPHIPVVWALAVNAPLSNRGGDFYNAPWVYGFTLIRGLVTSYWFIILPAFAGLLLRIRDRAFRGALLLGGIFLLVAPWYQSFATRFGEYFTPVKDFGFDRFYFLAPFFFSIAAGFVLHCLSGTVRVRSRVFERNTLAVVALVIVLASAMGMQKVAHAKVWLHEGSFHAATHSPAIEKIRERNITEPFRVATIADERTGLRPTLANMNGFETFDGDINIASKRYVNFFKQVARSPRVEPKHSFYLLWQADDAMRSQAGTDADALLDPALLSRANVRFLLSPFPVKLTGFDLVHAPAAATDSTPLKEAWRRNTRGRDLFLYENSKVLPRVFASSTAPATVAIKAYQNDEVRVATKSSAPFVLVLANTYSPHWKARIDGVQQEVLVYDDIFISVPVGAGEHEVVFAYQPPYAW